MRYEGVDCTSIEVGLEGENYWLPAIVNAIKSCDQRHGTSHVSYFQASIP